MAKQKFDPDKAFKSIVEPKVDIENNTNINSNKSEKSLGNTLVVNIQTQEKKTKRINLLLKPSVYNSAMSKCKREGVSLNEVVNKLLEAWSI